MGKKPNGRKIVSFYISPEVIAKLQKRADRKQWSLSQTVAQIVEKEFAPRVPA